MNVKIEEIWEMDTKDFFNKLNILDCQIAEDRYILLRMIDNNLKLKSPTTQDKWLDIYSEFREQMNRSGKKITKELTEEENQKEWLEEHRANMRNQGL